jgi:hypothetical protein
VKWLRSRRLKRAEPSVSQYLDQLYSETRERGRSDRRVVDIVEALMEICGQDVLLVQELFDNWYEDRLAAREAANDEEGAHVLSSLQLSIVLVGIGNLFGFVPDEAPAFDRELALEGRSRGWRPTRPVPPRDSGD